MLVYAFCNTLDVYSYQRCYSLLPTECSEATSRKLIMVLLTLTLSVNYMRRLMIRVIEDINIALISYGQIVSCQTLISTRTVGARAKAKGPPQSRVRLTHPFIGTPSVDISCSIVS